MKGYRFYLEYPSKTEKNKSTVKQVGLHIGNCIALDVDQYGRPIIADNDNNVSVVGALYPRSNSECIATSISYAYLLDHCKRIPESLARDIHPRLFVAIDYYDTCIGSDIRSGTIKPVWPYNSRGDRLK